MRPKRDSKGINAAKEQRAKLGKEVVGKKGTETGWKEKHAQMQAAIKVARQFKIAEETGDKAAYQKAIEMSDNMPKEKDTRVECPYCQRRFAESKYT